MGRAKTCGCQSEPSDHGNVSKKCVRVARVASSLRFLELHVGYDFKMSSGCVAPWRKVDPRHVPVGKRPLTLAEWVQIESVADQVSCARRWLLLAWLALLGGVVRFAHIQRTELDEVDDSVGGLARRGKNRTRKPLPWSLPSTLLTRSFAVHFSELRDLSRKAGVHALLPDLKGADFESMSVGSSPLPLSRFHALSRRMFLGEPFNWNHDRVQLLSSYSARRTLPTVADVMGMAPGDRAALGAWADNAPKSTITQIVRRLKMPMRYSDARDARGLLVKKAVMRHLRVAVPLSGVPNCCWKSLLSRYPALGKRNLFARRVQRGFRTKSGSHSSKRVREPGV